VRGGRDFTGGGRRRELLVAVVEDAAGQHAVVRVLLVALHDPRILLLPPVEPVARHVVAVRAEDVHRVGHERAVEVVPVRALLDAWVALVVAARVEATDHRIARAHLFGAAVQFALCDDCVVVLEIPEALAEVAARVVLVVVLGAVNRVGEAVARHVHVVGDGGGQHAVEEPHLRDVS